MTQGVQSTCASRSAGDGGGALSFSSRGFVSAAR